MHERQRKKMSHTSNSVKKKLSLCLKGNRFTRVSEEGLSVAQKGFVPSNTAGDNKWALDNFESWRSQVALEESSPDNLLLTDNPKIFVLAFASMLWRQRKRMDSRFSPIWL